MVPHKRNKLHTEEPVLRIVKVNRAVKKASSGSGFGGGGGGVMLWQEVAGAGFYVQWNSASAEEAGTGDPWEAGAMV